VPDEEEEDDMKSQDNKTEKSAKALAQAQIRIRPVSKKSELAKSIRSNDEHISKN
jgi:hypothetical protein